MCSSSVLRILEESDLGRRFLEECGLSSLKSFYHTKMFCNHLCCCAVILSLLQIFSVRSLCIVCAAILRFLYEPGAFVAFLCCNCVCKVRVIPVAVPSLHLCMLTII